MSDLRERVWELLGEMAVIREERDEAQARAEAAERVVEAARDAAHRFPNGAVFFARLVMAALTAYDNQRGGT